MADKSLDEFLDEFLNMPIPEKNKKIKIRKKETVLLNEPELEKQESRPLRKRSWVSLFILTVLIPLTIYFGIVVGDRDYYLISLAIVLYAFIPFVLTFEGRKPQARELVIIAVLSAIGVAGRAAFFMLPQFKPVVAIVIVSGLCFGPEAGFFVGATTAFVSNLFSGQGPWTPWQMLALALIGFLAGLLFQKKILKQRKLSLSIYGFLATFFIYGGLMNMASLMMYSSVITWESVLAIYITGAPFDLIHAFATVFFLVVASRPMIEKLERIKIKYGLIEGSSVVKKE